MIRKKKILGKGGGGAKSTDTLYTFKRRGGQKQRGVNEGL